MIVGLAMAALPAAAGNTFLGVSSGDASSTQAVVWTRCVDTNAIATVALTAQVSADLTFASHQDF